MTHPPDSSLAHPDLWLLIDVGYACGDVVVRDGKVIDSAPVFKKWVIGMTEGELRRRVKVIES